MVICYTWSSSLRSTTLSELRILALFRLGVGMGGLVDFLLWNVVMVGCRCEWKVVEGSIVRTGVVNDGDPKLSV